MKRVRRTDDFKLAVVKEVLAGEEVVAVARKNSISQVLLYRWIKEYKTSGTFGNRTKLNREPVKLDDAVKEIQHLTKKLEEKDLEIAILRDMLKKRIYHQREGNDCFKVD